MHFTMQLIVVIVAVNSELPVVCSVYDSVLSLD